MGVDSDVRDFELYDASGPALASDLFSFFTLLVWHLGLDDLGKCSTGGSARLREMSGVGRKCTTRRTVQPGRMF